MWARSFWKCFIFIFYFFFTCVLDTFKVTCYMSLFLKLYWVIFTDLLLCFSICNFCKITNFEQTVTELCSECVPQTCNNLLPEVCDATLPQTAFKRFLNDFTLFLHFVDFLPFQQAGSFIWTNLIPSPFTQGSFTENLIKIGSAVMEKSKI